MVQQNLPSLRVLRLNPSPVAKKNFPDILASCVRGVHLMQLGINMLGCCLDDRCNMDQWMRKITTRSLC